MAWTCAPRGSSSSSWPVSVDVHSDGFDLLTGEMRIALWRTPVSRKHQAVKRGRNTPSIAFCNVLYQIPVTSVAHITEYHGKFLK